ncbi:hypothetical protein [Cohnella panacarvi]|uniref:hypothetical protein n=1 Tax=Cohnella panacarvi TaxID=400776 RepID=UPI00047BA5F6|nr:hypothetical protein [Cohnella panacarvi]
MSRFEQAYSAWLNRHIAEARGERLRRLLKKHGYGEKLLVQQAWWPAVGHFDDLYPEYEFIDSRGNYYYFDFGFVRLPRPTVIESDSFSYHARDVDRDKFARSLDRQNEIVLADWNILRFSIDKLKEDPVSCQNIIGKMMVNWYGGESSIMRELNVYQREIVRLATRSNAPITFEEACHLLGKGPKQTRAQLYSLMEQGILESVSGKERIHRYRLKFDPLLQRIP